MNAYRGHTALVGRHLSTRLRAIATALLLLLPIVASPAQAAPAQAGPETAAARASTTHVYLLRGVLNIFSLGLDQIAARLQAQGIQVTISNYVFWSSLASEAAATDCAAVQSTPPFFRRWRTAGMRLRSASEPPL